MNTDKETTLQNLKLEIAAKQDQIEALKLDVKALEGDYILTKYDVIPGDEINHDGRAGVVANEQHGEELRYYPVILGEVRSDSGLPPRCSSKIRCVYPGDPITVTHRVERSKK
jgi:hypothetical protein